MFLDDKPQGEVTEVDEAAQLLLEAASLLEQRGWHQGSAFGVNGSMCMFGAIRHVRRYGHSRAVAAAERRVDEALGMFMGTWNDERGRTAAEVIAKLRAVALNK